MKRWLLPVIFFILPLSANVGAQIAPPDGWRFPTQSDYSDGWVAFRASYPVPFHARADFNGDDQADDAWILLSTHGKGWGLFVFLTQKDSPLKIIILKTDVDGKSKAQNMGISVTLPGNYTTACGNGYLDCEKDEPRVLHLEHPDIDFIQFEASNSYFWWDKKENIFRRTWMSD